MDEEKLKEELLADFQKDRMLAHKVLFPHRHKDEGAPCHDEIVKLFNSGHSRVALEAFRGCAKSTLVEETATLKAAFRERKYIMIVGPSWSSACDRLFSIKQELETNDNIIELFGPQQGPTWAADNIVTASGCKIQAIGAGQSMRGKKHGTDRPDLIIIDDLEDEENTATEEARRKLKRWMNGVLIPCLHPTDGQLLFIGTSIHPKALIVQKREDPSYESRKFPIVNLDLVTGEEKSAWPARFPMDWITKTRTTYLLDGAMDEFNQEYMCRAEDETGKPFQANMIRVAPVPLTYMPIDIIVDPARTVNKNSARTGYVAASSLNGRIIVHEALGAFHRPDEIIKTIFEWNDRFNPVNIGVETNALEEFIMQPLRTEMQRRGISLPLVDLRAPKDKIDFIKGLQPFYVSGSVTHVKRLPDLEVELLGFPTGRIDVINALAYILKIRAGRTVYEDFNHTHIAPILELDRTLPRYFVVSSRPAMTAGAILQYIRGEFRIIHSMVYNMPPQEAFPIMLREAITVAGDVKVAAPLEQFDHFTNVGLPAAFSSQHIQAQQTDSVLKSEGVLGEWLRKSVRGTPALLVSQDAKWVVNALGGGYSRKIDKHGILADKPVDNQYRLVMEAIESYVSFIDRSAGSGYDENRNYSYTKTGVRYLTSMPGRR